MMAQGELVDVPVIFTLNEEGWPTAMHFDWLAESGCEIVGGVRYERWKAFGSIQVRVLSESILLNPN